MSPAVVHDVQVGPRPSNPFMKYYSGVACQEHPDWHVSWQSDTALGHLANMQDLEDMAAEHNDQEHDGATVLLVGEYTPTPNK